MGAQVNVVGTVNVFEAAKRSAGRVQRIAFASSAAVFDADDAKPGEIVAADATGHPTTLYGVYKMANEGTAAAPFVDAVRARVSWGSPSRTRRARPVHRRRR